MPLVTLQSADISPERPPEQTVPTRARGLSSGPVFRNDPQEFIAGSSGVLGNDGGRHSGSVRCGCCRCAGWG
jgi:hypothetical protein